MKVNCHQFTNITELLQGYANDSPIYHIQIPFQTTSNKQNMLFAGKM